MGKSLYIHINKLIYILYIFQQLHTIKILFYAFKLSNTNCQKQII